MDTAHPIEEGTVFTNNYIVIYLGLAGGFEWRHLFVTASPIQKGHSSGLLSSLPSLLCVWVGELTAFGAGGALINRWRPVRFPGSAASSFS